MVPGVALAAAVCVVAAISLLGSVFLSTIANGIAVLMVYGAGLVSGLLGQIGYALPSQRLQDIGRDASWALPFDALYQAGLHALTANTSGLTGVIVHLGPLGGAQGGGPLLVAWSRRVRAPLPCWPRPWPAWSPGATCWDRGCRDDRRL